MDAYPAAVHFNVIYRKDLIERYNTHKQWTEDASTMANNATFKSLTKNMEWMDWRSTLVNFLNSKPGRNRVPLNYVVRDNKGTVVRNNINFLDNYVNKATLTGISFSSDASNVHSYLVLLISENSAAEQKIIPNKSRSDGRVNFMALKEYYEGVGANEKSTLTDERDIQDLFYSREKPPHMWWD